MKNGTGENPRNNQQPTLHLLLDRSCTSSAPRIPVLPSGNLIYTLGNVGSLIVVARATGVSCPSAGNRETATAAPRFRSVVNNIVVNLSEDRLLFG